MKYGQPTIWSMNSNVNAAARSPSSSMRQVPGLTSTAAVLLTGRNASGVRLSKYSSAGRTHSIDKDSARPFTATSGSSNIGTDRGKSSQPGGPVRTPVAYSIGAVIREGWFEEPPSEIAGCQSFPA